MSDETRGGRPLDVFYIGGYGRSGSTLLDRLLGSVRGFFSAGELRHVWNRGFLGNEFCGCGRPFRECEFWTEVARRAFGGFDGVDVQRIIRLKRSVDRIKHIPRMAALREQSRFTRRLEEYGTILQSLYAGIQDVSGCQVIIDSSKDPSHAFLLQRLPSFRLRLLHLVRDSRAVAFSWQRKKEHPGGPTRFLPRYHPIASASLWNLYNYPFEMLRRMSPSYRLLRYEDFVEAPQEMLAAVIRHAGGDPSLAPKIGAEGFVELGPHHTAAGNPMRFDSGTLQVRPDVEWRNRMRPADRALVTALTFHLLKRYGYALDSGARGQPAVPAWLQRRSRPAT